MQPSARKCKHCGEFLDPALKAERVALDQAQKDRLSWTGRVVLALMFVLFGLILLWMGIILALAILVGFFPAILIMLAGIDGGSDLRGVR